MTESSVIQHISEKIKLQVHGNEVNSLSKHFLEFLSLIYMNVRSSLTPKSSGSFPSKEYSQV
jgi:hypothetical protein